MANLEQSTEHIDDMQNLNSINSGEVALDNASLIVNEFPENEKRKVVSTEKYVDEYGRTMIKEVYEDNSRSIELAGGYIKYDYGEERHSARYYYTEFYPNGNKKFHCSAADDEGSIYAIYNKDGKMLYCDYNRGTRETDSASAEEDNYFKYENGRLVEDKVNNVEYEYNDREKKVIVTNKIYDSTAKHVVTYKMDDSGNADFHYILSDIFIGETGAEINLMKGGLENLIKNMGLEDVPYIYYYKYYKK